MMMDEGLDTGGIIMQESVEITSEDTAEACMISFLISAEDLLLKQLIRLHREIIRLLRKKENLLMPA